MAASTPRITGGGFHRRLWQKTGLFLFCLLLLFVTYTLVTYSFFVNAGNRNMSGYKLHGSGNLTTEVQTQKISLLLYNRVPKCGSRTVFWIIEKIKKSNKITLKLSMLYHVEPSGTLNRTDQLKLVNTLNALKGQNIYGRHLHFVDFTDFNTTNPVYINVIRDPIDRQVSNYYFIRFERGHIRKMSKARRNMTFDECVSKGDEECNTNNTFIFIPYFCGQHEFCGTPGQAALNEAIKNVEKYFPVVGVMEDMRGFFQVIEHLFPAYFRGASKLFYEQDIKTHQMYNTKKKKTISRKTWETMSGRLQLEYEFYYYIRQRAYQQLYLIQQQQ